MSMEDYSSDKGRTDVLSQPQASIACYKARDAFYTCLEREASKRPAGITSAGLYFPAECKPCREKYVNSCRPAWVEYFDREYCDGTGKNKCRTPFLSIKFY